MGKMFGSLRNNLLDDPHEFERLAGTYLPVTAVLGGLLYAKPEDYKEAKRDVIRLSSDLVELQKQQGYATCEPEEGHDMLDAGPLHCSFLIIPAQVRQTAVQPLRELTVPSPA